MPNLPPESTIHNFLANHTTPLPTLPSPTPACPICLEDFTTTCPPHAHPAYSPDDPEYPIRVTNCGSCTHIFGRRCIENLIRQRRPHAHTCPLCREEWFPASHRSRGFLNERVEMLGDTVDRMDEIGLRVEELVEELVRREGVVDREVLLAAAGRVANMRALLGEFRGILEEVERVLLTNRWI